MAHTISVADSEQKGSAIYVYKRKNKMNDEIEYVKDAFLYNPVASATECTGYVQNIPDYEYEAEAYGDLQDVPVSALDGADATPPAR